MKTEMDTCVHNTKARITGAKDREHAWAIINEAPEGWRNELIRHAKTVFAIRKFYARPKKVSDH